jgi:hypothetical protein
MPLPPITFPTLGWQVIDWIEAYLCHGPGDVQGDEIHIDDEEALHLCWAYRVWPKGHPLAGRRIVEDDTYSRPKGRRKSELAAMLVCAEGLGPVRCERNADGSAGFDANGDPVGVPVTYPFIRCLATEEEQTGNTYDKAYYMLTEGEVTNAFALDVGLTRTFIKEQGGGEIRPSTSGDASKDGGLESFSVGDETHLYVQPGLRRMYATVKRNTGKRKIAEPWFLKTTTAWQPGERSIAEQDADRYMRLPTEQAVTKHAVLYDHRQGDEPKRFNDDRSLIKALKTGYGPAAEWMDFPRIVRLIRGAEDPEADGYRYWLNRPRAASSHWLSPAEIKAVLKDFKVKPGSKITAGFDGSENDDHTALMGCTADGDVFTVGIWTPEGDDLGWRQEVMAAVEWLFSTFKVVRFYGDPPWWQEEMAKWAAEHDSPPVAEFWTNIDSKMAVACGALRTAIRRVEVKVNPTPLQTPVRFVANDQVTDGPSGKPLLEWHFENARTRKVKVKLEDRAEEAHVVRKERPGSPLKIDSVTSSVLARRARDDAKKAGEFDEPEYGRASWSGGSSSSSSSGKKAVDRSDYMPVPSAAASRSTRRCTHRAAASRVTANGAG